MNIETPLSTRQVISALRYSIADGNLAHIYANLTGGVFLPALALTLDASPFQIGILASIPFFANFAQLPGAYLVEHVRRPKLIAIGFYLLSRGAWISIVLMSLLFAVERPAFFLNIMLLSILVSHLFGAIGSVSWFSWMAGLVPDAIRGRFFGFRNSLLSLTTIIATIAGGYYLDWFKGRFPQIPYIHAFELLLLFAVFCAGLSIYFLAKMPELDKPAGQSTSIFAMYRVPLYDKNFRSLMLFAVFRAFATSIAGPFFLEHTLCCNFFYPGKVRMIRQIPIGRCGGILVLAPRMIEHGFNIDRHAENFYI